MLANLHIKNLALIDELDIDFRDGLNILTGETGAGKSIIIGSIGIGLGGRFDTSLLRDDSKDGLVELIFIVDKHLSEELCKLDIEVPEDEVVISRRCTNGRTVNRINDSTVTLAKLKAVSERLISLHAQHEQRTLLKASRHLELVDSYSNEIPEFKTKVSDLYHSYKEICDKLDGMSLNEQERVKRLDYIRYEINDIESARLTTGEDTELEALYKKASDEIADSPAVFANMSAARSNSYQFLDEEQVDMVSFLTNLKKADYKQQVMKDEDLDRIADSAKACVVYRNSDSQEGINGLAIDFPYKDLYSYNNEYKQLKAVKYRTERKFFDRFCSIMASQRMNAAADKADKDSFFGTLFSEDYTAEEWYVKGFEDYDTTDVFIDIPVTSTPDGYLPQLPDKTWDTVLDCEVSGYIVTDKGLMYIGREHFTEEDAEGHPLVSMDGSWAHINGHLVCYEADDPVVSEDGTVYRGTVHAVLNDKEKITIHIEWDPVTEDSEGGPAGHVTGYSVDDEETFFFMKKGLEQFETGDTIEFLFDFYDEEGTLIKTEPYGDKMHVITDDRLTVSDEMLEAGTELQYFGILTDVYQRELLTEEIREQVQ